jgi:hypothetical protein
MRTRVFRLRSASVVSFPRSRGSEQIFGVGLDEVMQHQAALFPSLKVPFLLVNLAADLFAYGGTHETGLFRLCVAEGDVLLAMKHISSEPDFILHDKNPHLAAVLIKRFLMTLPEPLCPWALYESAIQAAKAPSSDTKVISNIFSLLPVHNQEVVKFIGNLLHKLSSPEIAKTTLMDLHNLCVVFAPATLRSKVFDMLSIENSVWEQKFTLHLMQWVRVAHPDDFVGNSRAISGTSIEESKEGDTLKDTILPRSRWKTTST